MKSRRSRGRHRAFGRRPVFRLDARRPRLGSRTGVRADTMWSAFGILRGARRACGWSPSGSARHFRAPAVYAAAPDAGSAGGASPGETARVPSTVVRGTYAGVNVAYTVTHGDDQRGYPGMTVAEMCAALEKRYEAKRPPAERHIHQLIDKVATPEDARAAARAVARFRAERAFLAAGDEAWGLTNDDVKRKQTQKRHGLHPKSLLMFAEKCVAAGDVALAVDALEKRHVFGFEASRAACERLLEACETSEQVLRTYAAFRKEGFEVDGAIATATVAAAARVGDADAAERWMGTFAAAGVPAEKPSGIGLEEPAFEREDSSSDSSREHDDSPLSSEEKA